MSNLTPEPENIPEEESLEIRMIKRQWQEWDSLIQTRGKDEEDFNTREYEFAIDRDEDESLFSSDDVRVIRINEPYITTIEYPTTEELKPEELKPEEGEKWIQITVNPKNPYKPNLGVNFYKGHNIYYSEELNICLTNKGRAFEATSWGMISVIHSIYEKRLGGCFLLKREPKPEEIRVQLQDEHDEFLEPFQPLRGQNLERLGFLLESVKSGNIIE